MDELMRRLTNTIGGGLLAALVLATGGGVAALADPRECHDCNGNGVADYQDIADGTSEDVNENGVPDECECISCLQDVNCDGDVGIKDLLQILGDWGACPGPCPGDCPSDIDDDGEVGVTDLLVLLGFHGGDCLPR